MHLFRHFTIMKTNCSVVINGWKQGIMHNTRGKIIINCINDISNGLLIMYSDRGNIITKSYCLHGKLYNVIINWHGDSSVWNIRYYICNYKIDCTWHANDKVYIRCVNNDICTF